MTDYRFDIGERVTYSEKRFPTGVWATELVVVEQLTKDGTPQYRLRIHGGATEYVLAERRDRHGLPEPGAHADDEPELQLDVEAATGSVPRLVLARRLRLTARPHH